MSLIDMNLRPYMQFRFRDREQYEKAKMVSKAAGLSLNELVARLLDAGLGRPVQGVMADNIVPVKAVEGVPEGSVALVSGESVVVAKNVGKPRKAKEVAMTTSERLKQMREGE